MTKKEITEEFIINQDNIKKDKKSKLYKYYFEKVSRNLFRYGYIIDGFVDINDNLDYMMSVYSNEIIKDFKKYNNLELLNISYDGHTYTTFKTKEIEKHIKKYKIIEYFLNILFIINFVVLLYKIITTILNTIIDINIFYIISTNLIFIFVYIILFMILSHYFKNTLYNLCENIVIQLSKYDISFIQDIIMDKDNFTDNEKIMISKYYDLDTIIKIKQRNK